MSDRSRDPDILRVQAETLMEECKALLATANQLLKTAEALRKQETGRKRRK
jgi:hypothetical protein